jgi:chromosome segregation ATPase
VELSYKAAATANKSSLHSANNEVAHRPLLSETEIQVLYDRLKERLTPTDDSQVTTEDLGDFYQQSQRDLEQLKGKLDINLRALSGKVDALQTGMAQQQASIDTLQQDIQKQNGIIKAMQEVIMAVMGDF